MAGSCPCGDLRCLCVRPCLCCSCTCWCDECRRLRKGLQHCDSCKKNSCRYFCRVLHGKPSERPQCPPESCIAPIAGSIGGEASGHCSNNPEPIYYEIPSKEDESTDDDSDEPMLEIDDKCSSSKTSNKSEESDTSVPGCSKTKAFPSRPQPRKKMIDLSGGLMVDDNRNPLSPEEYRQQLILKRNSNLNLCKSVSHKAESMRDAASCSQSKQADSKSEESKITESASFEESKSSPKKGFKKPPFDDSALHDKFFGISRSPTSPLSISVPSAFSIPQPREEMESGQQASNAQSPSVASTSRMMAMLKVSNAHSADKEAPESKSAVQLVPEPAARGPSPNPPLVTRSQFNKIFNDYHDKKTTIKDQKSHNPEIPFRVPSPEKSDNLNIPSEPNLPEEDMQQSSDESEDESSNSNNKPDNVSRKC